MARKHGRNSRIYMGIASESAAAEPLPFLASWDMDQSSDHDEVTALGDRNKEFVGGLPAASGNFSGFYDDATDQTYAAALDGMPRKFYLYPDHTNELRYFHGKILPDIKIAGGVAGAITVAAKWDAASEIARYPVPS